MDNKLCKYCGKVFTPKNSRNIYCSKECGNLARKINSRKERFEIICEVCGNKFWTSRKNKKVCCKECQKIKKQKYDKTYLQENKDKIKTKQHNYYLKNKDKIIQKSREYEIQNKEHVKQIRNIAKRRRRAENPEKYREKDRQYNKHKSINIKEAIKIKRRNKWKNNQEYRLKNIISHQIYDNLHQNKIFKTFELLDYNIQDLKSHLESLFQEGMSWENYGYYGWHIDHIKPVASFKLINDDGTQNLEEIKKCWALDNLQPLWAKDNISKGSWYIDKNGIKKQYKHNKEGEI